MENLEVLETLEEVVDNADTFEDAENAVQDVAAAVDMTLEVGDEEVLDIAEMLSEEYVKGASHATIGIAVGYVSMKLIRNRKAIMARVKTLGSKIKEGLEEGKAKAEELKVVREAEKELKKAAKESKK